MHASEPSNASRTLLFDINKMSFDAELCELFGVPRHVLGDIGNTSGRFGRTTSDFAFGAGIPISAAVGDQQGALFGQGCFSRCNDFRSLPHEKQWANSATALGGFAGRSMAAARGWLDEPKKVACSVRICSRFRRLSTGPDAPIAARCRFIT